MEQQSFIYKFLLSPQLRVWRYVALILFFAVVSLNQALAGYKDFMSLMGDKVYWVVAGTILVYIITVYLILKVILKNLLSGRYVQFVLWIILCASIYLTIPNIVYALYIDGYDLFSESVLIDNLSAFVIYILCISGVIIPAFLKNWIISNQYLNQLKVRQKTSQVEQLKEQINPKSFFKVLNKSKTLVKSDPNKASLMLMKLSELLRYQLYDCNRSQVLLSAEISFLENFLKLEKLYFSEFTYTLTIDGKIKGIFIPSFILLPYVQSVINAISNEKEAHSINVQISNLEKEINVKIYLRGNGETSLIENELLKVKERLETLYQEHYDLTVKNEEDEKGIEIVLQLAKQ